MALTLFSLDMGDLSALTDSVIDVLRRENDSDTNDENTNQLIIFLSLSLRIRCLHQSPSDM